MNTKFLGAFKLNSSENFDEYLKSAGVGFAERKIYIASKPTLKISESNGIVTIAESSPTKNTSITFTIGAEFEETAFDGRELKTTITEKDGQLVQSQAGDLPSTITRYIEGDQLIETYSANGVTATRTFDRQA